MSPGRLYTSCSVLAEEVQEVHQMFSWLLKLHTPQRGFRGNVVESCPEKGILVELCSPKKATGMLGWCRRSLNISFVFVFCMSKEAVSILSAAS